VDFGRKIAQAGFMVITGAGPGIMKAGNEGAGKDNSFGINIKLPLRNNSTTVFSNKKMNIGGPSKNRVI